MNKAQKIFIGIGIASAVGITYAITALRGLTDGFNWDDDEDIE